MTNPSGREEVPQSDNPPFQGQTKTKRIKSRTQRLIWSGAGLLVLAGLGALAAFYTAPFADPPAKPASAPTSIVPPSAAKPSDKPSLPGTTASEALRQLTLNAHRPEAGRIGPQPKAEAPSPDDPRWAKAEAPPKADNNFKEENTMPAPPLEGLLRGSMTTTIDDQTSPAVASPADNPAEPAGQASPQVPLGSPQDGMVTAAISPTAPGADEPNTAPQKESAPPAISGDAPSSKVTVTIDAKMHNGPRDEAAVVAIIPNNAIVGLIKCESWCEVVYKGRRGFVYKGLIDSQGAANAPQKQAPAPQQAPAQAAVEEPKGPKVETPKGVDLNSVGR